MLEAASVRGDVVKLLVRFRVMNTGKAPLSTQDLSRCGWGAVFPAGCGDAYLVRKASDTRITLVKKRCSWYLRVKLKPHNELPYTECEEFLEVMSMDQRAGVWPVEEGGSSSSSGPAFPEDVEESEPVKRLVAPTAPTATDREEHTASGHAVFRTWCHECCIGRGRMHQHRAGGREITIPAIAIDYGYLNERDDLLQEAAGAPILVSKCNRDRWIGAAIVPTKGADEYAVAELKNDVSCSRFTEVRDRSDNEMAILALKEPAATALKLAGVNVKMEESALYDSQSHGLAESAVKDVKDAVRTNLACLVRRFGQEFFQEDTQPSPDLACEVLRGDGGQVQESSRLQESLRAAQGSQVRASTASFCAENPLHHPWSHERGAESRTKMGG